MGDQKRNGHTWGIETSTQSTRFRKTIRASDRPEGSQHQSEK